MVRRRQWPRQWAELSRRQRSAVLAAAAVEVVLTAAAIADLARRPKEQVRGSRPLWLLGCFVQPVGPIAYLFFARRPAGETAG
jgi:Phospholipase_D-nuclease N-terminal